MSYYRGIANTRTEETVKMNEPEKASEKIESEDTSLSFADFRMFLLTKFHLVLLKNLDFIQSVFRSQVLQQRRKPF